MIIIMGSVGSGKSEQAIRLTAKLNCPRVSTSQLLKQNPTPEREARMLAGDLVDDNEVIEILETEFKRINAAHKEFVADGSPRSVKQAEWMLNKSKAGELKITAVIKLDVSEAVVVERLSKRGRDDDKDQVIKNRLKVYNQITQPVIDYFRNNGIEVNEVNGELSLDEVQEEIMEVLKNKL